MATTNAGMMVGWTRPMPGHEAEAVAKFGEFGAYLGSLQSSGQIESYEPVMTVPHGGDLNGFFMLRGEPMKLAKVRETEEWKGWTSWGSYHMMGFGIVDCYLGGAVKEELTRFSKFIRR